METIYQLNADDLNEDFLEGLKASFKHKDIEVVVYERPDFISATFTGKPRAAARGNHRYRAEPEYRCS